MQFEVSKGFEIERKRNKHGVFDKSFWKIIEEHRDRLPDGCGCYVSALKNGSNIVVWYVGKTEKCTFRKECFQAHKVNIYN